MPKQKSSSTAKKRFFVMPSGNIKRASQGKNHILTKKSRKRKRSLRQGGFVDATQSKTIKKILPYE
jgi:large subunit ribosomal protein L35